MALLLSISTLLPCEQCDDAEPICCHYSDRVRVLKFYCYASIGSLVPQPSHTVEVPHGSTHADVGWYKRDGRPICPEHRQEGDVPYPKDQ